MNAYLKNRQHDKKKFKDFGLPCSALDETFSQIFQTL